MDPQVCSVITWTACGGRTVSMYAIQYFEAPFGSVEELAARVEFLVGELVLVRRLLDCVQSVGEVVYIETHALLESLDLTGVRGGWRLSALRHELLEA